jgi:mannose-6-phosphate isomerase-like protein (cupin superfamily)
MLFKLKNAGKFGWKGIKGLAYNSKEDFPNASAAYIEVAGTHGKIKITGMDGIYLILEGKGEFVIGEEKSQVEKRDVVIVPKNTPYNYHGKMKLFLVHCPAFDPNSEIKLE